MWTRRGDVCGSANRCIAVCRSPTSLFELFVVNQYCDWNILLFWNYVICRRINKLAIVPLSSFSLKRSVENETFEWNKMRMKSQTRSYGVRYKPVFSLAVTPLSPQIKSWLLRGSSLRKGQNAWCFKTWGNNFPSVPVIRTSAYYYYNYLLI